MQCSLLLITPQSGQAVDEPMADAGTDEKMNDMAAGAGEPGAASAPEASSAEQNGGVGTAGPTGTDAEAGPMEADAAAAGPKAEAEEMEVVKKKRAKKVSVPYSARTAGLSQAELEVRCWPSGKHAVSEQNCMLGAWSICWQCMLLCCKQLALPVCTAACLLWFACLCCAAHLR